MILDRNYDRNEFENLQLYKIYKHSGPTVTYGFTVSYGGQFPIMVHRKPVDSHRKLLTSTVTYGSPCKSIFWLLCSLYSSLNLGFRSF